MSIERFIVWMRAAPTNKFRKMWAVLSQNLTKGKYRVSIANNWLVSGFGGEKHVVVSQTNRFGGKNVFLSYIYMGFGALMLLTSVCFGVRKGMRSGGILEEKIKR